MSNEGAPSNLKSFGRAFFQPNFSFNNFTIKYYQSLYEHQEFFEGVEHTPPTPHPLFRIDRIASMGEWYQKKVLNFGSVTFNFC